MPAIPDPDRREDIEAFFREEVFLAFFDFKKELTGGNSLSGLVKVARPGDNQGGARYLSLTFIVDTPKSSFTAAARQLLERLNETAFRRHVPDLKGVTSVPGVAGAHGSDHYIHNMDLVFGPEGIGNVKERVNQVVVSVRQGADVQTEVPQWWAEENAPAPTADERANWGGRLKALLKTLGNHI